MTCHVTMSASDDCLLGESEVRTRELAPQVGFEPTTRCIVAATDRLQVFRFPQSSRQGVVEFITVFAQTWRVRVKKCRRSAATNTTLRRPDVF